MCPNDIRISTHSAREDGDCLLYCPLLNISNFNPLRPRGRRRIMALSGVLPYYFNPLRPRGRRLKLRDLDEDTLDISTHSAREDGDWIHLFSLLPFGIFQPTPPARTETNIISIPYIGFLFQPTPPARTETNNASAFNFIAEISTHSAREDGDMPRHLHHPQQFKFQPTPPARTETSTVSMTRFSLSDFNPLRPRGRRPVQMWAR